MAAAQAMAEAVFPDSTAPMEGPLAALEQSTVAARRAEVRAGWAVRDLQMGCTAAPGNSDTHGLLGLTRRWHHAHWLHEEAELSCIPALLPPPQGLKLYWRALEGLVAAEAARPDASPGAGASLLAASTFHRCVAACAFELVAAAYRVVSVRQCFLQLLERCSRVSAPCLTGFFRRPSGQWLPHACCCTAGQPGDVLQAPYCSRVTQEAPQTA